MPSNSKTPHLGLNRFIPQDKPKMEDFNFDNQQLDEQVGGHIQDGARHLSPEKIEEIQQGGVVFGSFVGDGKNIRALTLPFAPRGGVVYIAGDLNPVQITPIGSVVYRMGFFSTGGSVRGLTLSGNQLEVRNQGDDAIDDGVFQFNRTGQPYVYWLFR